MTAPTQSPATLTSKSGALTITTPVETPKRAGEFVHVSWKAGVLDRQKEA